MILDFEKHIADLEKQLKTLKKTATQGDVLNIPKDIERIEKKLTLLLEKTYANLTPWEKVQVARHPNRPRVPEYFEHLITDFVPLSGDRCFGDDKALLGGLGRFRGQPVVVMGHGKSQDIQENIRYNFGMAHPEGYRKAVRLMDLAHQFRLPIITLVDTPGAYPGVAAEERGQAQAIAICLEKSFQISCPIMTVVVGEGGSGGAVALAVGNYVGMLEHAVYAVISPEGCSSILWRTKDKREDAAKAQKITAQDLKHLAVIDAIINEPPGAAHRNPATVMNAVGDALEEQCKKWVNMSEDKVLQHRKDKFLQMTRKVTL